MAEVISDEMGAPMWLSNVAQAASGLGHFKTTLNYLKSFEFEKDDELYNDFYKDKIEQINLYILYVDNNNDLFHIKKDTATLNNGRLEKDDLKKLIRQYIRYENKKYRLISLLKWNITIEPDEISNYLRNEKEFDFIKSIRNINSIEFEDSINLFHNLNSLYLVFHERWKLLENKTKKVYLNKKLSKNKTRSKKT